MALKVMLLAAFLGWLECDVVLSNKYWNVFQTISKLWRVWFCSFSWYTFHTFQTKAMCCSQNPFLKPITKPGLETYLLQKSVPSQIIYLKGNFHWLFHWTMTFCKKCPVFYQWNVRNQPAKNMFHSSFRLRFSLPYYQQNHESGDWNSFYVPYLIYYDSATLHAFS